jgi:hypothetical protein
MNNNDDQLTCESVNRIKAQLGLPTINETLLASAALDLLLALERVETVFSCWDMISASAKESIIVETHNCIQAVINKAYGGGDPKVRGCA